MPSLPTSSLAGTLLRHGAVTLTACLLITAALTAAGKGPWDVNLVYSLAIGLISWLTIDLARLRWRQSEEIPWPRGLRGPFIVVLGIALGFGFGSLIGQSYIRVLRPELQQAAPPSMLFPMAITIATSILMSWGFYVVGKARHLQMQAEQAQRQAAEARLGLLQAQLEPHMLFNTLANLRVLIGSDPQRATHMLDHLIAYLRATLSGSRSGTHSLQAEFALLADYLALMQIRMGPRLSFALDLPESLSQLPVPPLLLQPLVENSIRHGLEPQLAGGHIQVQARQMGENLQLSVSDNGGGIDQDMSTSPATEGSRFGLEQIRERLTTRYGQAATLKLIAASAGGTLATIQFPLNPASP
ncbi:MAG: histidine kinase [Comamonas sp.]